MGEKNAIRDAYGAALEELGRVNEKVVGLEADVASSTKSGIFGKTFPDRYFNVGISEIPERSQQKPHEQFQHQ